MHGSRHRSMPPYAAEPSGVSVNRFTSGSSMLMPIPAGTVIGLPSRKTSRCACTWYANCSFTSDFNPAATVRLSGSDGAGQRAAGLEDDGDTPCAGVLDASFPSLLFP